MTTKEKWESIVALSPAVVSFHPETGTYTISHPGVSIYYGEGYAYEEKVQQRPDAYSANIAVDVYFKLITDKSPTVGVRGEGYYTATAFWRWNPLKNEWQDSNLPIDATHLLELETDV